MTGPQHIRPPAASPSTVHDHFARHMAEARDRSEAPIASPPDAAAIETMVDAAFWASLRREESYIPRISLAFLTPDQTEHPLIFEHALPLDAAALVRLCAGGRTAGHPSRRVAPRQRADRRLGRGADDPDAVPRHRSRGAGPARRQTSSRRGNRELRERRGAGRRSGQDCRRAGVEHARLPVAAGVAHRFRFLVVMGGFGEPARAARGVDARARPRRVAARGAGGHAGVARVDGSADCYAVAPATRSSPS